MFLRDYSMFRSLVLLALFVMTSSRSEAGTYIVPATNLSVTNVAGMSAGAFNNNPVGTASGSSWALTSAGLTRIVFWTDGGVAHGSTPGISAAPADDAGRYIYGVAGANGNPTGFGADGTTIQFLGSDGAPLAVTWFYMLWGSIDTVSGDGVANTLTLGNGDVVTGTNLMAAGDTFANPVNGDGDWYNANDNQWLKISDSTPFSEFNARASQNSFEFDMATSAPELSTWAMMLLGFAGLCFRTLRGSRRAASHAA
jgi:hypothetical protein